MKGKSYQYAALQLAESEWDAEIVEMVFTQLTLKAALKTWGNDARAAAKSEMKQLHWRNSFKPVRLRDLTERQKQTILESHIIMKQKRTGEIKGRTVAGGNKQRGYIDNTHFNHRCRRRKRDSSYRYPQRVHSNSGRGQEQTCHHPNYRYAC